MDSEIFIKGNCNAKTPGTMGTDARSGPENRPMKIANTPQVLMKASPRASRCGLRENGYMTAIDS
jgi:hypothetical protein